MGLRLRRRRGLADRPRDLDRDRDRDRDRPAVTAFFALSATTSPLPVRLSFDTDRERDELDDRERLDRELRLLLPLLDDRLDELQKQKQCDIRISNRTAHATSRQTVLTSYSKNWHCGIVCDPGPDFVTVPFK